MEPTNEQRGIAIMVARTALTIMRSFYAPAARNINPETLLTEAHWDNSTTQKVLLCAMESLDAAAVYKFNDMVAALAAVYKSNTCQDVAGIQAFHHTSDIDTSGKAYAARGIRMAIKCVKGNTVLTVRQTDTLNYSSITLTAPEARRLRDRLNEVLDALTSPDGCQASNPNLDIFKS